MTKIGFIGGGNMAQAIIAGIKKSDKAIQIFIYEPSKERQQQLENDFEGLHFAKDNKDLFSQNCDATILAVKPQIIPTILEEIKSISENKLLISIAAGISSQSIKSACSKATVVRIMPNTPFLVMEGCGGISFDESMKQEDKDFVLSIFQCSGDLIEVPEEKMHIITALSGSGPAYIFKIAENMIQAGIKHGLSLEEAKQLTSQTIKGAGTLLKTSDLSAEQLRINVTSPKGTTEAALNKMNELNLDDAILHGIDAAYLRSKELANN